AKDHQGLADQSRDGLGEAGGQQGREATAELVAPRGTRSLQALAWCSARLTTWAPAWEGESWRAVVRSAANQRSHSAEWGDRPPTVAWARSAQAAAYRRLTVRRASGETQAPASRSRLVV